MTTIRLAEKKDKEEILYLFKLLDKKHIENIKEFKPEISEKRYEDILFKAYETTDYVINVGEFKNKIIGFSIARLIFLRNHLYLIDCNIGEILYLIVDDDYKRQGIGRKIIKDMENRLIEKKVERIEMKVYDFNEEAQPQKLGYTTQSKVYQKVI